VFGVGMAAVQCGIWPPEMATLIDASSAEITRESAGKDARRDAQQILQSARSELSRRRSLIH